MFRRQHSIALALPLALVAGACGGGGSSSERFEIQAINLNEGAVWRINRRIEITFTKPVDPSTVNLNSINVRRVGGGPAAGEFSLEDAGRTVAFQPRCPTLDDLSDAGLLAGLDDGAPYQYELNIIGASQHAQLSVHASDGEALEDSQTRRFTTPISTVPSELYLDPRAGPPVPRVIGDAPENDASNSSYAAIGSALRAYFERQGDGGIALSPELDLPLNKLSDPATGVAFMIRFDQPVDPSPQNLAWLRLEYRDQQGAWRPLVAAVTLEANCTSAGALVRLSPLGLLPSATTIRALVAPEFTDLIGEPSAAALDRFALAPTEAFPISPDALADEVLEDFDSNAAEDAQAPLAEPRAIWGGGEVAAKFDFDGTGGVDGDFDWYVGSGSTVIFNTSSSAITGGRIEISNGHVSFVPTGGATFVGGEVDVDDFYLEAGATLKIEGPNPLLLQATGDVTILGTIDASGSSSFGVSTVGTTNLPEPGAPGQAGGGRGGFGHPVTNPASMRAGAGFGAFNAIDGGGQGGETGWSTLAPLAARRGAGGGGGRFGPDIPSSNPALGAFDQTRIGLDAERGFDNTAGDNGALSGPIGPLGGDSGPSPFFDPDPANNFFGSMYDGDIFRVVVGELARPWAGSGGGGGGDAVRITSGTTFPGPYIIPGYQKGAGAGGGGGSVRVLALGKIAFVGAGRILCRGGSGGGGENTSGNNHVGGASGGGSGGHVILESASDIDFSASTLTTPVILATGGQGGAGASGNGIGGAFINLNGNIQETSAGNDACPAGYPSNGTPNGCRGLIDGTGGDGGPGLIQLHTSTGVIGVDGGSADIVLAPGVDLRSVCSPPPVCAPPSGSSSSSCYMLPSFGRLSRARSRWIALGLGAFDAGSPQLRDVVFELAGLDPATGKVETDAGGSVLGAAPLIGPLALQSGPAATTYIVTPGGRELVIDAASLVGTPREVLLDNTHLLWHFQIELVAGSSSQRFDIAAVSFDATSLRLTATVDGDGPSLLAFAGGGATHASLRPAFYRVRTNGAVDYLPASAAVTIRWQATRADSTGAPDPSAAIPFTADPAVLSAAPSGDLRFVRFDVLFDIDALNQGLTATNAIPTIEFLRLPFSYR